MTSSGRSGTHDGHDDAALLRAHVAGDPAAFGEIVRRHRDRLWAVALRTLGDREEAADAVQDAMVSAYRSAGQFRGDSAVTTWLHRIVVNACLDRARRRRARPTVPLPDQETEHAASRTTEYRTAQHDSDVALTVQAALAQLPLDQRLPLVLLDMHGYSVAEIAAMLDIPEGTVKSRCARGRARLAVLLGHLRPMATAPAPAPAAKSAATSDIPGSRRARPTPGNQPSSGDVGSSGARPASTDRASQDRASQDRASQDRASQDRASQDRADQDRAGQGGVW